MLIWFLTLAVLVRIKIKKPLRGDSMFIFEVKSEIGQGIVNHLIQLIRALCPSGSPSFNLGPSS